MKSRRRNENGIEKWGRAASSMSPSYGVVRRDKAAWEKALRLQVGDVKASSRVVISRGLAVCGGHPMALEIDVSLGGEAIASDATMRGAWRRACQSVYFFPRLN